MKTMFCIFCLLITMFSCFGKDNYYEGWIMVDGKKISYAINFTIAKNNLISGTSLTAAKTKDETKCKIKGKYNPRTKSIYFYETVVISSKAKYENLNFCLLNANLKQTTNSKYILFDGIFTGYIRGSKKKCAIGSMHLSAEKPVVAQSIVTPIKPPKKVNEPKMQSDTLYSTINSKKLITYTYAGKGVTLEIWDDIQPDGDRISIYLDGRKVLDNYELTATKKRINVPVSGKHYLKIEAENEGSATPNTSRIRLIMSTAVKELTAHIKTSNAVYIVLEPE